MQAWIDAMVALPESTGDRDAALKRIDMIAAHDTVARLGDIQKPTLIICGEKDSAAPVAHSEELAAGIPNRL